MRILVTSALAAGLVSMAVLSGCTSSNDDPARSNPDSNANASSNEQDSAACFVLASSYENTCTVDSDCVGTPTGGNVCDPCSNTEGALFCEFSALPRSVAATYRATLEARDDAGLAVECTTGSCPLTGDVVCMQNKCVMLPYVQRTPDAGDTTPTLPDAASPTDGAPEASDGG